MLTNEFHDEMVLVNHYYPDVVPVQGKPGTSNPIQSCFCYYMVNNNIIIILCVISRKPRETENKA